MNLLRLWGTRKFFSIAALYYLLFFALLVFAQRGGIPDSSIIVMQLLGMGFVAFFSLLYDKQSIAKTLLFVLAFQLLCCYGLRYFNIDYFHNALGYRPLDALIYNRYGSHIELSLVGFIKYLNVLSVKLDDMGFSLIVYFVYSLAGDPLVGIHLLVLFNVFAVLISSFYVYKISIMFFEKDISCFAAFFWGTELYAVYTASVGLKENFMVMFIVIAIYYIVHVNRGMLIKDIVLAVVFSLIMLLFRTAIFYMLISALLFILSIRLSVLKRYFYVYIFVVGLLGIVYTYQIVDEIAIQQGYNYEFFEELVANKIRHNGRITYMFNYLASAFGPFPNLISEDVDKQNYITLYSFSSFCKVFYSFFLVYGIYNIFKKKHFELIALFVFMLLNSIMLVFTLFAQHDRYQWPHIPFTIILALYGLKCWKENRHLLRWDRWYLAIASLLIIVFNFR